jgi:uncharacterized membrane protein
VKQKSSEAAARPASRKRTLKAGAVSRPAWLLPTGFIMLSAVPIIAGSLRVAGLSGAAEIMPTNAHTVAFSLPVILHIISASVYLIIGAFQFSAGLRRRRPDWHRAAGRPLMLLGPTVALSALRMNQSYPRPAGTGDLLYLFRLLLGTGMILSVVFGFTTIQRGDVVRHWAWMIRAYAIGLAAGTQVFTLGIGRALFGTNDLSTALLTGVGWAINLAVAEWAIRMRTRPPATTRPKVRELQ